MRHTAAYTLVLALAVLAISAYAADAPIPKGPSLGDQKYTIRVAGILDDVVPYIAKVTGRHIMLQLGAPNDPQKGAAKKMMPVDLDFKDATLSTILMSLCTQVGLVYESQGGGGYVQLRDGNPDIDSRPTVVLQDYVVCVRSTSVSINRTYQMGWGMTLPDAPGVSESFQISLDVAARAPAADLCLAGIDGNATATTDKGTALERDKRFGGGDADYYMPIQRNGGPMSMGRMPGQQYLQFALPPAGVHTITRLEGALRLYSVIKTTELKIPAESEGQTIKDDDVSLTVKSWKKDNQGAAVTLEGELPQLPHKTPGRGMYGPGFQTAVVLVGKDGGKLYGYANMEYGGEETPKVKLQCHFGPGNGGYVIMGGPPRPDAPPFEPDYMLLTINRYGDADKRVPFVLENIPVP
jgi:hypothetical protein